MKYDQPLDSPSDVSSLTPLERGFLELVVAAIQGDDQYAEGASAVLRGSGLDLAHEIAAREPATP